VSRQGAHRLEKQRLRARPAVYVRAPDWPPFQQMRTLRKITLIAVWTLFLLALGVFAAGYLALHFAYVQPQPGLIYGMLAAHWLATLMACGLAMRWSIVPKQQRFWHSLIFSLLALASSCWGLKAVHISSTQTVNGRVQHVFDSHWLFEASMAWAFLAFVLACWNRWRKQSSTHSGAAEGTSV